MLCGQILKFFQALHNMHLQIVNFVMIFMFRFKKPANIMEKNLYYYCLKIKEVGMYAFLLRVSDFILWG